MKLIMISLLIAITTLFAETIYETHTYTMGDNDSRSEARQICFLEAKRKLIEKVGVYIESNTTVKNYQLEEDEIKSFSAALMKVETVNENWSQVAGTFQVELKIKAEVDKNFHNNLLKLLENKESRDKISKQQVQLKQLEAKLDKLNKKIGKSSYENSEILKKERNVVFEEISKTDEIMLSLKTMAKKAVENVRIGMKAYDVYEVAGDSRYTNGAPYMSECAYNYGEIWVIFSNGFVVGYITHEEYMRAELGYRWSLGSVKPFLKDFVTGRNIY